MKHLLPTVFLLAVTAFAPACTTDDIGLFNDRVEELQAQSAELNRVIDEGRTIAETLPPGEDRSKVLAAVETARQHKAIIDGTIDDYIARIKALPEDANALDAAAEGAGAASTVLPPPWGQAVAGLGVLLGLAGEWRRRRTQNAAGKVVRAIEKAKDDKGVVNFNDPTTATTLRSVMGSDGQKLVRAVK